MDALRPETLHKLEQNDPTVTKITLGHQWNGINADHFSRLGAAIATNSHLKELEVDVYRSALKDTEIDLFDGIKRNCSIQTLKLICGSRNIVGSAAHELLKAYQHENNNLTNFTIEHAGLQNGGDLAIANTLRCCRNLKYIDLSCDINDEHMLPMMEALRGCQTLEEINLDRNRIGNVGCDALTTLLRDPNSNLQYLSLPNNQIGDDGAIAIANSLTRNAKLKGLYLSNNRIGQKVMDVFSKVLCDTSSINSTYSSNHSLLYLSLSLSGPKNLKINSLLRMNKCNNKHHVAIKKILEYHPIDMEPLFELDENKERSLKGLPLVIDWFERAKEAHDQVPCSIESINEESIDRQKLSAIYQFASAMPLLFIPTDHTKGKDTKRKRADGYS